MGPAPEDFLLPPHSNFWLEYGGMSRSPRNVRVAFNHAGLTHYGGSLFLHEFLRLLQLRHFLARHLDWVRRNSRYSLSQMILALTWPIILGLDRLETASLLRSNGTFQFLTGLPSFPDPQTLRRFLMAAPRSFAMQMGRANDRLLQLVSHLPNPRSRMILDLDSTVVTVFGHQQGAAVGYNPLHRGKKSYQPVLCVEANSAHLWGASLRSGQTDPHSGTTELLRGCWSALPAGIREVRARADAGFYHDGFLSELENCAIEYAVVAKIYPPLKRMLPGLSYRPVNPQWEMGECQHRAQSWSEGRRHVFARRLIETSEGPPSLFTMGRYQYLAGSPTWTSAGPAFSTSTMDVRSSRFAFANCVRISLSPTSLHARFRPTLYTSRSCDSPTTSSLPSSESAYPTTGRRSPFRRFGTNSSPFLANSFVHKTGPCCDSTLYQI